MTDRLDFGAVRNDGELEAQAAHDALAFNAPRDSSVAGLRAMRDGVRLVRRGGDVVGGLVQFRMGLFLGGRSVRNVGIASVAVDPTARGRGAAKTLMTSMLAELREEGVAVSTLYPTTFTLYGRAGYAVAGHRYRYRLPLAGVGRIVADAELRRLDRDADRKDLERLYRRLARKRNGWLDRDRFIWDRVFRDLRGEEIHGYAVPGEDGELDGYVVYTQGEPERYPYSIEVRDVQAANARAARRLLALFADCRTLARDATWHGALDDHLLLHVPELGTEISVAETWMLRIVDIVAAFGERGYPPGLAARLDLEVEDDVLAGNRGRWTLSVDGGAGELARATREAGPDALRLDIRALASLYTGHLSARRLADLGLAEGSTAALNEADRIFAGPPPSMPDYF